MFGFDIIIGLVFLCLFIFIIFRFIVRAAITGRLPWEKKDEK